MKKHIFFIITSLLCLFAICFSAGAEPLTATPISSHAENITVQFREDTAFTLEEQQRIRAYFLTGEDLTDDHAAQTQNLLCSILGHKYRVENILVYYHCVRPVQPRCDMRFSDFYFCTRCSDAYSVPTDLKKIECCEEADLTTVSVSPAI